MDKATQRGKILAYCAEHGSITIREASELRLSGNYDVQAIEESRVRNGETVRYKRYFIKKLEVGAS